MKAKRTKKIDPATQSYLEGVSRLEQHPIFAPLFFSIRSIRNERSAFPHHGWAIVSDTGTIHVNPKRKAAPDEWLYVLSHCLLHLGFGHFQPQANPYAWNVACDLFIYKFLKELKIGKPPETAPPNLEGLPLQSERDLYGYFLERGVPDPLKTVGVGDPGCNDMSFYSGYMKRADWQNKWMGKFSQGLRNAVTSAVNVAGGSEKFLGSAVLTQTSAQRAKGWLVNSFPLIGALAAGFKIVEDLQICNRQEIRVAAVNGTLQEIYINPAAGLTEPECGFVIAHEILHVGLRHEIRRQGREPYLWNVACDYVVNGWLMEIGLGEMPAFSGLYDQELKGESAESLYNKIAVDLRRLRKLATLRGTGACDIIESGDAKWWAGEAGIDLDGFYRRCLAQGLEYHQFQDRGFLPQGLIEEIRALAQPPIPWDVELAQWFDGHFRPVEKIRSYARLSRRQSGSPEIPRPHHVPLFGEEENRTFGVVLDTSGSMDRTLLAKALGTIAGYSLSRDVARVRVVFCDAAAYDQGYIPPENLLEQVQVKGRGGTVLQPGIDLLEKADDFPKNGPILIITDGACDRLSIRREHAFLIPEQSHLPFVPRGKVFRIR
ncbi:MAG: peptidase [Nitrospirae bacterium]|nr:peptidase [Nitrospirota bacterium]MBI3352781.1 peptidase [Nitrospirota bacterium]